MEHYPYIIIGGGMTAAAALEGIRARDNTGKIALISAENNPPYTRPWLSRGLWTGKPYEKIWRKVDYPGTELVLGRHVIQINPKSHRIEDQTGNEYEYDRLLLATGGKPRRLPFGGDDVLYFRRIEDYHTLRQKADRKDSFAVIGGGFIGSEIAAALCMQGCKVTMIFPEEGISSLVFPADLSQFVTEYFRQKGAEILAGQMVSGIEALESRKKITTKANQDVYANEIVAGIGIEPNVELARDAEIKIDNGIVVNEYLETSNPDIYAAGDVASFYNPALSKRMRVEHEDNALMMGKMAGENLTGARNMYHHLPYFYSDLFDLGYEAVGELDPKLEIVQDWADPYRKGVIYYLDQGRVRGILLWNVWDKVPAARELIQSQEVVSPAELSGKLLD